MPTDVDGLWAGSYQLYGARFRITVRLAQSGGEIRGVMNDSVLHLRIPLDTVRVREGMTDEAVAELTKTLFTWVPSEAGKSVAFVSRLPAAAELNGFAQGAVVRFRKTYQGTVWAGWQVGDYLVGDEQPGHSVEYEGEVLDGGRRIEGRWWIEPDPATGAAAGEGRFELRREA